MLISPLQRFLRLFAGGALLASLALTPLPGGAAPLGKEECKRLKVEKKSLAGQGVAKNMAKGPEWVKANLGASQLDLIKRYILVNEQLKFRCSQARRAMKKKMNAAAARIAARKAAAKAKAAEAAKSKTKPATASAKQQGASAN